MTRRLVVLGTCLRGAGYPNAEETLALLANEDGWRVDDLAGWLPDGVHLWRVARGPVLARLRLVARLLFGSLVSLIRVLARAPRETLAYAPYPSIFLLLWASLLPMRVRPRIVADAYISLWDSMYRDRGEGIDNLSARILRWAEGRALRAAHAVVADTEANREWMIEAFCLSPERVHAMPLAVNAAPYMAVSPAAPKAGVLRVLFIGTLVPLHGVQVIADAVRRLAPDSGITFTFIGDGQDRAVLEALEADSERASMRWQRTWASPTVLASAMADADVCLGVFGGGAKAARVLPFKLYLAMAAGRAVVTQRAHSRPAGVPELPWRLVEPTPEALAEALLWLRDNPDERLHLGTAGREAYCRWLGSRAILREWRALACR